MSMDSGFVGGPGKTAPRTLESVLTTWRQYGFYAGVAGTVVCVIGWRFVPERFFPSYLVA